MKNSIRLIRNVDYFCHDFAIWASQYFVEDPFFHFTIISKDGVNFYFNGFISNAVKFGAMGSSYLWRNLVASWQSYSII